jgi:hypothetical protein
MFIEHPSDKLLVLAPAERNGLAYHCRKHCAPLERGSCSQSDSINIWLRWSQGDTWLRPKPRCASVVDLPIKINHHRGTESTEDTQRKYAR